MSRSGHPVPARFDSSAVEILDGSKAIEVTALFENTILGLHHFTDPRGGGVTAATRAWLGSGAAALLAAATLFVVIVVQATTAALEHNGAALDVAVSGCVVYGVFALFYGLFRRFDERRPRDFTIGPDATTLFKAPADLVPRPSFPLVRSTGQEYELLITSQMTGDVSVAGHTLPIAELGSRGLTRPSSVVAGAAAYTIPPDARITIGLGQSTFLIASVAPPRHYPYRVRIDWSQQSYTLATGIALLLFLGMMSSIPQDPKSLALDDFMRDRRFATFVLKPADEPTPQMPTWLDHGAPAGGKGARPKGATGRMGKEDSKQNAGLYSLKGFKSNPDPHLAKQLADAAASKAGVLGILKSQEGSIIASVFGRESALGSDNENVLGGLIGTEVHEAFGHGGVSIIGTGKGGGSTGEDTIGLSKLDTIGKGGGGGDRSGYGRNVGSGLGTHHVRAPEVTPGTAQIVGTFDKEIIRRIIRQHLAEVRFCYESQLLKRPALYGRVMMQFTIAGTGRVVTSAVQSSTLNDGTVEQCIADAVHRWEFTRPPGGGIAIVSYPFVLKAAD